MAVSSEQIVRLESMAEDLLNRDCRLVVKRCVHHRAAPRWRIPKQDLADHLLYFVHDGAIDMRVNDCSYQWQAGDLFWIPAGCQVHARPLDIDAFGKPVFDVARFFLQGYEDVWEESTTPVKVSGSADVRIAFAGLERALTLDRPWAETAARSALVSIAIHFLDALSANDGKVRLTPRERRSLHAYVQKNVKNDVTAGDLAELINMTPARLRKVMKRDSGLSPRAWISRQRLRHVAHQLSDTDRSVADIAEECGYRSLTSFYRMFTRQFGMTPTEWRQQADPRKALLHKDRR